MGIRTVAFIATNVEAITSKGLRASYLSKYTEADASYNVELTAKTFIGFIPCVTARFYSYLKIIRNILKIITKILAK